MAGSANINLLKNKTGISPEMVNIEVWLRMVSLATLAIVIVVGMVVGGGYIFLQQERVRLEQEKATLEQQLAQERQKEGMLATLKRRVALMGKIQTVQRSMGSVLSIAQTIAPGSQLTSIIVDEQQQIKVTAQTASIEEAAGVIINLLALAESNRVVSPELVGLELGKDGSVKLTVSFVQGTTSG